MKPNTVEAKAAEAAGAARNEAIRKWHSHPFDPIPTGYLRVLDGVLQQEVSQLWQRWDGTGWDYEDRVVWQAVPVMFTNGLYPVSPGDKAKPASS